MVMQCRTHGVFYQRGVFPIVQQQQQQQHDHDDHDHEDDEDDDRDGDDEDDDRDGDDEDNFALDGAELEQDVVRVFGDNDVVRRKLVNVFWHPTDLRAFDESMEKIIVSNNGDEKVAKMSPSEVACALSHIASWKGVERHLEGFLSSLLLSSKTGDNNINNKQRQQQAAAAATAACCYGVYNSLESLQGLIRVAGFAQGPSLSSTTTTNVDDLPPVPVCMIVEDDAIFCERFSERLELLLRELPRDFHYCALGYSRPKRAPMVSFSTSTSGASASASGSGSSVSQLLAIPTCLWYATGYLLSLEGARYLQAQLPLKGPVDAWLGMRMCANFENVYGEGLGVGIKTSSSCTFLPRRALVKVLKFRAYCAKSPLVSQEMWSQRTNWRERDSDIEYSGGLH
eukprot:CAMPEP_0118701920 /NCGR_PEP_ID=MMETSP0800-20121206/17560_1 /TAXON_ID=210618 ORGANISM="Striatella unipunctata, Strain CCMP2910" /NCGR_SAMPLE_ID=MMETSP0800 /ASSEMBLY_ACC=CAM_ASM_000638 /LENGTH=397 /DNA_ID=CAMNT_0006602977 /DNA_START=90 /DNA_END=1283 /DNA_ORIENTATION=-